MMDCFGPCDQSQASLTRIGHLHTSRPATRSCLEALILPGLMLSVATRFNAWRRRRRDAAFLMRQPDHMLRDIGIGRAEIEIAVRGSHGWRRRGSME
jgi:uncharacterized protein YjiS (DUF1127 family)